MRALLRILPRILSQPRPEYRPTPARQNVNVAVGRSVVPLLIYPRIDDGFQFNQVVQVGNDKYYTSAPWEVDEGKVHAAVRRAEEWMAGILGTRIRWERLRPVQSRQPISEWRARNIGLLRPEVERVGLPWTGRYVYVAMVRGMGGYAGGIKYERGSAGYAMVGDICLEAVSERPSPTAGSELLGANGWPAHSYSAQGQTGALIHESLHGLDLPHPDGWPEGQRPDPDSTIMGSWWNWPNFRDTGGLTNPEIARVRGWLAA